MSKRGVIDRYEGDVGFDFERNLVKVMGDPDCLFIISSCIKSASFVQEISRRHAIPIAVCYRKVNNLVEMGILNRTGHIISPRGKRIYQYRAVLENTTLQFLDNRVEVSFRFRTGETKRFQLKD